MTCVHTLSYFAQFTCLIGLGLSCYAYYVETTKALDANYVAMCDISEHMSCSKVFTSEFGKGFGIVGRILGEDSVLNQPNGLSGIAFYSLLTLLCFSSSKAVVRVQLGLCILSIFLSIYLAYLLYVLNDLCVVCVSTYVVNVVTLILVYAKLRHISDAEKNSNKKSAQKKKK